MERAPVQPTRHWAIADYFQRTFEKVLILRRVLRPRRICNIYDLFVPFANLLTYLLHVFCTRLGQTMCNFPVCIGCTLMDGRRYCAADEMP